jgi:hypothetical protein
MQFGTLVHLAILEPNEFARRVFVFDYDGNLATKEGKAMKAALGEKIESLGVSDSYVVKPIDMASIERMAESFHKKWAEYNGRHFDALGSFVEAKKELPLFATLHETDCKGQIDILSETGYVCDVKTTSSWQWFERDIERNGYDVQLAHYQRLAERNGFDVKGNVIFFAVESVPPFRCSARMFALTDAHSKWAHAISNMGRPSGPWVSASS